MKTEDGAGTFSLIKHTLLVLLGALCVQLGMSKLARRHLEAAVQRDPGNAEAKQLLKKLRWV